VSRENTFVSTGQFAAVLTLLTGQRIYIEKVRNVMKLLPDTIKQEGRYTMNREDAWDYFRDNYSGTLKSLKIANMEELLSQTKNM
jgi:hypothetical protein